MKKFLLILIVWYVCGWLTQLLNNNTVPTFMSTKAPTGMVLIAWPLVLPLLLLEHTGIEKLPLFPRTDK